MDDVTIRADMELLAKCEDSAGWAADEILRLRRERERLRADSALLDIILSGQHPILPPRVYEEVGEGGVKTVRLRELRTREEVREVVKRRGGDE